MLFTIDRDPTHFGAILNFLRDGSVPMVSSARVRQELLREADFYGLDQLIEALSDESSQRTEIEQIDRDEIDLTIPVGLQMGDFNIQFPRGYEIVSKKPVTLMGVKFKCKMATTSEGWVRLYSADDSKQLAEGTYFYGLGKKAWVKSSVSYKLIPQKRYLLLVYSGSQDREDKYYYTIHGGYETCFP